MHEFARSAILSVPPAKVDAFLRSLETSVQCLLDREAYALSTSSPTGSTSTIEPIAAGSGRGTGPEGEGVI